MEYVRYCPICGSPKVYSSLDSFRANKNSLLCRKCARSKVFEEIYPNKVEKLLYDVPETYYWIGYLLADGHFDVEMNRLKFTQNNEDKISVYKFAKYIDASTNVKENFNGLNCAEYDVMSDKYISQIIEKFDIHSDKTHNPPALSIFENMDIDLLAYLFIGFVDGDGNIGNLHNRPDFHLRIKVYSSWLSILQVFEKRLFNHSGYAKINNQGYAVMNIGNTELLKNFKRKYLSNISFEPLNRKWDKIDLNYTSRYIKGKNNREQIKDLYNQEYTITEISKKMNLSYSTVYSIIKGKR